MKKHERIHNKSQDAHVCHKVVHMLTYMPKHFGAGRLSQTSQISMLIHNSEVMSIEI